MAQEIITGFSSVLTLLFSIAHAHILNICKIHPVQMQIMSEGLFFRDGCLADCGWLERIVVVICTCTDSKQNKLVSLSLSLVLYLNLLISNYNSQTYKNYMRSSRHLLHFYIYIYIYTNDAAVTIKNERECVVNEKWYVCASYKSRQCAVTISSRTHITWFNWNSIIFCMRHETHLFKHFLSSSTLCHSSV